MPEHRFFRSEYVHSFWAAAMPAVSSYDLFLGAEGAPEEPSEARRRPCRQCPLTICFLAQRVRQEPSEAIGFLEGLGSVISYLHHA